MPSTNSVSYERDFDSSTVITPSLPTLSITSEMRLPISSSWEERMATLSIWSLETTAVDCFLIETRTAAMPISKPRFTAIGSAPAVTFLKPSAMIAWARTVEVVVPSPASSLVFFETSLRSWAPIFSNGSARSISLAIVTPSELTWGGPNFLSTITFRPRGPSVDFNVSARTSMPALRRARASSPNFSSFDAISYISPK